MGIKLECFMNKYQILKSIIDHAKHIVFFTGAGISVPSGIPDFRSADGIYNQKTNLKAKPEEIISHSFFVSNTKEFYEFYKTKMVYPTALPNDAHYYIASLQDRKRVSVVTQNIDGLHNKAGSKEVYELHGSIYKNRCTHCNKFFSLDDVIKQDDIPVCDECKNIIKPEVVLYEEPLDEDVISGAINAISSADVLIVIGTSLVVYPAAAFLRYFKGKYLVVINKEPTSYDSQCDLVFHEDVVEVVKRL